MAYLNFVLDITQQSDGKMCISVLSSPLGEATVTVDNPFTPQDIQAVRALFEGPSSGLNRFQETQTARQFGQRLFNFLIRHNDDINAAYFASLDRAGNDGLRVRLSTEKAGVLAGLPWELLADPNRDFLALSRSTPVVRYTQQLTMRPPVPITVPLRVLVMIAAPADYPTLDVEGEWQRLQDATADLQKRGLLQLERLETATLIALQRKLRAEDYHVFHFVGHSAYDEATQQGVLVLEREQDESHSQLITGAALARELGEESTIRLVVLNSCQSARRDQTNPFSGIASSIVVRGVPAVVAMQFPITDGAAKVFAEEFYSAISELLPIDSAVSEARRAIANRVQNVEWATPVLYLRSEDGVLFRPAGITATATMRKVGRMNIPMPTFIALIILAIVLAAMGTSAVLTALQPTPTPTAIPPTPAARPNLQVVSMRSAPLHPAPGEAFRWFIRIRNAGETDSGPFNWTWDASSTLLGAIDGHIENIAPGASQNISVVYNYGWWGMYAGVIVLDIDGQVAESDERDNRQTTTLELDASSAFDIDFSLLPTDNEIVVPPRLLAPDEFKAWNLTFTNGGADPTCLTTQHQIVDLNGHTVLVPADGTSDACAAQPLVISLRLPVRSVTVTLIPAAAGSAHVAFFSDNAGTQQVFDGSAQVNAGEVATLGPTDATARTIRRVVIDVPGQAVRLSGLALLPVAAQ